MGGPRRFLMRLWDQQPIDDNGFLLSAPLDLRVANPDGLFVQVTSVGGSPDVRIQYMVSPDGVNFSGLIDPPIVDSTAALFAASPEGINRVPLTTSGGTTDVKSLWIQVKVTDLAATGDSLVTMSLECVEGR